MSYMHNNEKSKVQDKHKNTNNNDININKHVHIQTTECHKFYKILVVLTCRKAWDSHYFKAVFRVRQVMTIHQWNVAEQKSRRKTHAETDRKRGKFYYEKLWL